MYTPGDRWHPDRVMVDPYAPLVDGRRVFGQHSSSPNGEENTWLAGAYTRPLFTST